MVPEINIVIVFGPLHGSAKNARVHLQVSHTESKQLAGNKCSKLAALAD
jgi:hypothetical protein